MNYSTMYKKILSEFEQVFERLDQRGLNDFIQEIKKYRRIFVIGGGREGLAVKSFAMRLMHMGNEVHWVWDDTTPNIGKGDLLIAVLGDGQVGHVNYVCEQAKKTGAFIYVVTGSPSGKTARTIANKVFFIPAAVYRGKDEVVPSFQPMGNLFEQCLFIIFDMVIMLLVEEIPDLSFEKMSTRHRNVE